MKNIDQVRPGVHICITTYKPDENFKVIEEADKVGLVDKVIRKHNVAICRVVYNDNETADVVLKEDGYKIDWCLQDLETDYDTEETDDSSGTDCSSEYSSSEDEYEDDSDSDYVPDYETKEYIISVNTEDIEKELKKMTRYLCSMSVCQFGLLGVAVTLLGYDIYSTIWIRYLYET
jgi:hypothetical protein